MIGKRIVGGILAIRRHLLTTLSRNRNQTIIVLSLVIVTFTLLFILRAAELTGDSLWYAYGAKTGVGMFNPHHLLFTPIVHMLFQVFSSVCGSCDAIFAAQFHNIVWAAVAVVALYFIVRHLLDSSLVSILAAICLLVCQGFWIYSTQVEVYIPAIGCLTALLAILVIRRNENLTTLQTVGISLLLAMAVLYMQSAVLFCIPLAYYLIATHGRQGWKTLASILSFAGAIVLSTYIIVFVSISEERTLGGFIEFCFSYFDHPGWGTSEHFSISGVRALLYAQAVNIVSIPYTVGAAIFGVSLAVLSVWNIVQIVRHAKHYKLRSFLLLWLITHFIYFLWWIPWPEHFILTLIPLLLLAFITLEDITQKVIHSDQGQRVATAVIAILVIVFIFAENFQVVLPSHQTRGEWYDKAAELASIAPQECLIGTDWWARENLSYYFNITKHFEAYSCLKHFYRNEPPHELPYYEYGECIVIPWSRVTPELTLGTSFGQFNGYSHSSEWLAFIEWLFNFEYDSQHRLVACNEFEVIAGDEDIYILISSYRIEVDGLEGMFRILDNEIAEASGEQTNTLQSWLSTAYLE